MVLIKSLYYILIYKWIIILKLKCFEVETFTDSPKYVINVISPKYEPYLQNVFIRELKFTFINLFECANNHLKLNQLALPLLCTGNYGVGKFKSLNAYPISFKFKSKYKLDHKRHLNSCVRIY
jgi:hypothetical protein